MNQLTPKETIILGTAIAFELSKNKTKQELDNICSLLGQILYTLGNLKY